MKTLFKVASSLRAEACVQIQGEVIARDESQINKDMATGENRSVSEKCVGL